MAKHNPIAKILTERDYALMRFIGSGGVATLNQIQRKFWADAKERTCRERLLQLEKTGYLKTYFVDARIGGEQVFIITPQGAKQFSQMERKFFFTSLPAKHELKQQLIAQDVRLKLEQDLTAQGKKLTVWKNEHQLRSEVYHATGIKFGNSAGIPDARAVIEDSKGKIEEIDIEVDGGYFGKMLNAKLDALVHGGRAGIWVTTKGRANRIIQILDNLRVDSVRVMAM
jgi:Replication-relaxation